MVERLQRRHRAHVHRPAARLIQLQQMAHQRARIAPAALVGAGRQIHQLAGFRVPLQYHGLGYASAVDHQHVHFAIFQIPIDHRFAGVGFQQQIEIRLFADLAHLLRREIAAPPMPAAQRHIAFIAAQHDLFAGFGHPSIHHAGVIGRLSAAPAHGFDFLDRIRPRQQPGTALEQLAAEIRAQAVADHRNVQIIHDVNQLFHLFLFQKLRFIHDDTVVERNIDRIDILHINAGRAQAAARSHDAFPIAVIQTGLDQQRVLAAFVIIVLNHDGVRRLGGTHRAVSKVKLCHLYPNSFD